MTHTEVQPDLAVERARVLVKFGEAWTGKNLDALMSLVTDDCIYAASVGPEPGETFDRHDRYASTEVFTGSNLRC